MASIELAEHAPAQTEDLLCGEHCESAELGSKLEHVQQVLLYMVLTQNRSWGEGCRLLSERMQAVEKA